MEMMTPTGAPTPARPDRGQGGSRPGTDNPGQGFAEVMESLSDERPVRPDRPERPDRPDRPEQAEQAEQGEPAASDAEGVDEGGPTDAEADESAGSPEAHTDQHASGEPTVSTGVQPATDASASSETGETDGSDEATEDAGLPAATDSDTQGTEATPTMSDDTSATTDAEPAPAAAQPAATDAAAFRARLQARNASAGGPGAIGQPVNPGAHAGTTAPGADTGTPPKAMTTGATTADVAGTTPGGAQQPGVAGHTAVSGTGTQTSDQDATTGQGAGGTAQPGPAPDQATPTGHGVSVAPEGATVTVRNTAPTTAMPSASSNPLPRPDIRQPAATQLASAVAALQRRGDGEYTASIDLHPADLGRVHVEVEVRAGVVGVRVSAEQAGTRSLLSQQLNDLRAALEQGGLDAGELDLADHRWSDEQGWSDGQEQQRRNQPDGTQGRATTTTMPAPTQTTTTTTITDIPTAGLDIRL